MKQLIKKWRSEGKKCAMYLDDGICGGSSFDETVTLCNSITRDLSEAGLTINLKKSQLKPVREGIWIGFIIDTNNMFRVPQEKVSKFLLNINHVLQHSHATPRAISRIAGHSIDVFSHWPPDETLHKTHARFH